MDVLRAIADHLGLSGSAAQDVAPADFVSPEDLLAEKRALCEDARRLRWDEEREWMRAWAFFKGHHWVTWREDRLVEIEKQDVPRTVVNFIQYVVMTRLGHLIKNRPLWTGVPSRADTEARNATRLGVKVLEAYHRKLRMARKLNDVIQAMLVAGKAYLHAGWDPHIGGNWQRPLSDGQSMEGPLGDIYCERVPVHELLIEPGAFDPSLEDAQRVARQRFPHIGWVKKRWPDKAKDVEPIDPASSQGRALLASLWGIEGATPPTLAQRVELTTLYYRAGTSRPDGGVFDHGLYAIFANDTFLEAGPTPPGYDEIPFVSFDEIKTDGVYSTSVARGLIDLNKIVDVDLAHQEYNRRVLRPKTLVPMQSHIPEGAFDKTDDEVIKYYHPYKPEGYTPPALPAHHIELRNAIVTLIRELGGNFDIMSGKAQSDVRSGRMVSYLQEYAGTVLGVPAQNIEDAYEVVGNQMLRLMQMYVREDRFVPIVGRNRTAEIIHFKGEDLNGMNGVVTQAGSALPTSRAEKNDRIERWMEKRYITPEKGLKMLELPDPEWDLWADDQLDMENVSLAVGKFKKLAGPNGMDDLLLAKEVAVAQVQRENEVRARLAQPPRTVNERDVLRALGIEAFDFENAEVIVTEFNRSFRKTADYRNADRAVRALADAFADWHISFAQGFDPDNPPAFAPEGPARPTGTGPGGGTVQPREPIPATGGPMAIIPGQTAPGGGAVGPTMDQLQAAETGSEAAENLPPVRRPRPPGRRER